MTVERREYSTVDANIVAACILLGLPLEVVEERAAIMEFNGGMTRTRANKEAVCATLRARQSGVPHGLAARFFDNAAELLTAEQANGWNRARTFEEFMKVSATRETTLGLSKSFVFNEGAA